MAPPLVSSSLSMTTGAGLLCRAPSALLFIPTPSEGNDELVDAFLDGSSLTPDLGELVVERAFAVPPFVLITWADTVSLMVFGDVVVKTDQPSLPMLTGAASATWVEHHMRQVADTARVMIEPLPEDDRTDLLDGVVPAGGFVLSLSRGPGLAPPEPVETTEVAGVAPPVNRVPEQADSALVEAAIPNPDLEASLDLAALPPPMTTGRYPSVDEVDSEVAGSPAPAVEARFCVDGHANPVLADVCRTCASDLPVGGENHSILRPSLGALVLEDGQRLPLTTGYVFGRTPTTVGDDTIAWPLAGDGVSRQHLHIELRGWDVLVHDLGSTNGTIVVVDPDAEPTLLEPGTSDTLDVGSTVLVGKVSMRYVAEDA